jgi:hypothetical protein
MMSLVCWALEVAVDWGRGSGPGRWYPTVRSEDAVREVQRGSRGYLCMPRYRQYCTSRVLVHTNNTAFQMMPVDEGNVQSRSIPSGVGLSPPIISFSPFLSLLSLGHPLLFSPAASQSARTVLETTFQPCRAAHAQPRQHKIPICGTRRRPAFRPLPLLSSPSTLLSGCTTLSRSDAIYSET